MKTIEVDGIKVRIQIWDTAGQERYQTITKQYYRRAQGIFLVYDISSERSYQHIMKWVSDVDEYAPEGVQKILIGNKADEEQKRQVGREQGQQVSGSEPAESILGSLAALSGPGIRTGVQASVHHHQLLPRLPQYPKALGNSPSLESLPPVLLVSGFGSILKQRLLGQQFSPVQVPKNKIILFKRWSPC
ncbi:ras-related protein Rab-15 isoform X3 [Loxodonta africana]|nr:ras-related protein Rab-15 isoform X3 [Loxodonta africana]